MKINKQPYYVYMLECVDGSLYTGIAIDVNKRLVQHMAGTASRYTRAHKAKKIVYSKLYADKSTALKREVAIKKLSRNYKKELIQN
ncbi:MAG: GIY-YIG nuclease family protein [Patescibacteria group bacterium]